MQSLLTPIRYVINPRFHLTTPLQSGLFFLAPGIGFFTGTYFGGRYADHTVKLWIKRRGHRLPEDRLRSSFMAMGIVIPCAILIYGWAIEKEKGGIPLPVICMFVQGFAQTICFPSINTYCLDVFKGRSAEVIGEYPFPQSNFKVTKLEKSWKLLLPLCNRSRWHGCVSSGHQQHRRGLVQHNHCTVRVWIHSSGVLRRHD